MKKKTLVSQGLKLAAQSSLLQAPTRAQKRQQPGILTWFKDNLDVIVSLLNPDDSAPPKNSDLAMQATPDESQVEVDKLLSKPENDENLFHVTGDMDEFSFLG
jgi:hypothetical protein